MNATYDSASLLKRVLQKEFFRMNPQQQQAIFHVNGPLLILAGAGSGKTTVLINRIANLIQYGNAYDTADKIMLQKEDCAACEAYLAQEVPLPAAVRSRIAVSPCEPWRILAITFTNKAAGELKERLSAMLGEQGKEVWASTFHATCARILRRDGDRIGYSSHFAIYDTDDSRRLIKQCLKDLNIQEKMLPARSALSEISRAKDTLTTPEQFLSHASGDFRLELISQAYKLYQARLQDANAMDFDDLIANAVRLLRECPDVLAYYQNRFRYIMVDEYQDTNHAQYVFVSLLADKNQNLCVVGDDDQSIYKFRGATIQNILNFEQTFSNAKVIRLEQNYRSTKNILDAANAVIANNTMRKGKSLWTASGAGEKINSHAAYDEQDEAAYIAQKILDGKAAGRCFSDFAILYRMNSQSSPLERHFIKSGIPYRIIGGTRFYEREEIRDMIAYLSVINNPTDSTRLARILNKPKRAIGERTLAIANQIAAAEEKTLFQVISHANQYEALQRAASRLLGFAEIIQSLREAEADETVSLGELYQLLLERINYLEYLKIEHDNADERIENIQELKSNLANYEDENEEAVLSGFLEDVSLMTDIDNYDAQSDSVTFMTMHSAKGLEFPVVFLPGMEENIFPGMQAIYNPAEIEEERRLAYVAITRAREELYLIHTEKRMIYGSTSHNLSSRFLAEIPEDLLLSSRQESHLFSTEQRQPSRRTGSSFAQSVYQPGAGLHKTAEESVSYQSGDMVRHKAFGDGMVLSCTKIGNDHLLEISFETVGTKKLMSNFARLKKL